MANPEYRAASGPVTIPPSGSSVDLPRPAGTVDGDYVLIVTVGGAGGTPSNVAPAGFGSPLLVQANTAYDLGLRIFGKVAASEPANYSLTETANTGNYGLALALSYSNPAATPINASVMGAKQNSTTTPALPTLTTTAAGKLIGIGLEAPARSLTLSAAGAMTRRVFNDTGIANRSIAVVDEDIATTGSISGRSMSSSASGDFYVAAILLAGLSSGPTLHQIERGRSVARGVLRGV